MITIDVTSLLVYWGVGISMLVSLYTIPYLIKKRKQRSEYIDRAGYVDSEYESVSDDALRRIIGNLNVSYPVLLGVYGILLAFVVSRNVEYALSNSYFIIWCGWILAIIVRAGLVVISLFDLGEIRGRGHIGRIIKDAKVFFKLALFLLLLTVALLPAVILLPPPNQEPQQISWSRETKIAASAISLFVTFLVSYAVPFRSLIFAQKVWPIDFSIFASLLLVFGAFLRGSPLDPMKITIGQYYQDVIPAGYYAPLLLGAGLFFFMLIWYIIIFRDTRISRIRHQK